jgi:hypothetical protein
MPKARYTREQLENESQALNHKLAMRKYSKEIAGYLKEARKIAEDIKKGANRVSGTGRPYTTKGMKRVYRPDHTYYYEKIK